MCKVRKLTIDHILSTGKEKAGICPICHEYYPALTEHHIYKRAVFGRGKDNNKTIYICSYCQIEVDAEISRREGQALRNRVISVYEDTILSFVEGSIEVEHPKRGRYHR